MKTPLTLTRHNARAGKKGVYSPKHNDRSFDIDHAEHIDQDKTALNVYWDCFQGVHQKDPDQHQMTFEEVESEFFHIMYHESVEAQNERNIKNRHPERNRTTEDLLKDRRTCPEESILQIGNIAGTVSPEVLAEIAAIFFSELTSRYGEHFHILDWALHLDETTPHIQERHVFDCEDKYGHRFPQQEKALEMMGIELPDPSKPKSATNCRKVTFDKICRELLFEICENHDLYMQREVTSGGREYLEKQQYILQARAEELAKAEATLEAVTMKLEDADTVAAEVAEAAYVLEAGDYHFYLGGSVRDAVELDALYHVEEDTVLWQLEHRCAPVSLDKRMLADGSFELLPQGEERDLNACVFEKMEAGTEEALEPIERGRAMHSLMDPYKEGVRPLSDVVEGKMTMDEFVAQLTVEELIHLPLMWN